MLHPEIPWICMKLSANLRLIFLDVGGKKPMNTKASNDSSKLFQLTDDVEMVAKYICMRNMRFDSKLRDEVRALRAKEVKEAELKGKSLKDNETNISFADLEHGLRTYLKNADGSMKSFKDDINVETKDNTRGDTKYGTNAFFNMGLSFSHYFNNRYVVVH